MGSKTETTWTCDACGAQEVTAPTAQPMDWASVMLNILGSNVPVDAELGWVRLTLCRACIRAFYLDVPGRGLLDVRAEQQRADDLYVHLASLTHALFEHRYGRGGPCTGCMEAIDAHVTARGWDAEQAAERTPCPICAATVAHDPERKD